MTPKRRRIESWSLHDLKEHPRQQEMFAEHAPDRFQKFVADMDENGQRDPIEIGPDKTIYDGHHRVKAAKELGWKKIDVVVREDLANEGEAAQLRHMFSRNTQRRQMTELDLARAFRCMKNAAQKTDEGDLRDQIAALLGCPRGGRTLERLEKVLDMPPELQTAFSHGTLRKTVVYELSKLSKKAQEMIAKRLRDGENPAAVAKEYSRASPPQEEDTPRQLYFAVMDFFSEHLDTLIDACDQIIGGAMKHEQAAVILDRAVELFTHLSEKEREAHQTAIDEMRTRLPIK